MDDYDYEKPKDSIVKTVIDKLPIDKRQIDYLRKLKVKLENGVNVKILPKTKLLMKELFGLNTDEIKIKKNSNPLDDTNDVEDIEEKTMVVNPISKPTDVKPVELDGSEEVLKKIIDDLIKKNDVLKKGKPIEIQVIHKHYYYNKPDIKVEEEKVEEDDEDEDLDDEEDLEDDEEVDEEVKPKNKKPDMNFTKAFLDAVNKQALANLHQQQKNYKFV